MNCNEFTFNGLEEIHRPRRWPNLFLSTGKSRVFRKSGLSENLLKVFSWAFSRGLSQARQHCKLTPEANGYLEHAMEEMSFSARTLADLAGSMDIRLNDILEAIQYHSLDRHLFS
jgi:hypothetical protein